ncbi:helix-turn-helix transcriptional regulator [Brevibacterium album]|uniref:helix-turn-helix transcriptional regulator n=1 Tax=Brevibacterium album TaxID=417948 RepID=UPI0012EC1964|nr:helix-turn-helix transcriptional regulator [Brevibacterium album]
MDASGGTGGSSPSAVVARLAAHCREHRGALVAMTGFVGAGRRHLLPALAQALGGAGAPVPVRECVSRRIGPDSPTRRFEVLDERPEVSAAAALLTVRSDSDSRPPLLFASHADLLDEDSLRVLDVLVRSGTHTVVLAALEPPQRYREELGSPSGLVEHLRALTAADASAVVEQRTGFPPTPHALAYLMQRSGGLLGLLHAVVQVGMREQWLFGIEGRTVIARPPLWLDRRWAARFRRGYEDLVSEQGLALLERAALLGRIPLREAMADARARAAVVSLERAGVCEIAGGALRIRQPVVAAAFELTGAPRQTEEWRRAVAEDVPDRSALMALASGVAVEPEELGRGAVLDHARGNLHRAYALLGAVAAPGPRTHFARATIEASAGRPRRALRTLRGAAERAEAAGDAVAAAEAEAVAQFLVATGFRLEEVEFAPRPRVDASLLGPGSRGLYRASQVIRDFDSFLWEVHRRALGEEPGNEAHGSDARERPAGSTAGEPREQSRDGAPAAPPTATGAVPVTSPAVHPVSLGDRMMGRRSSELAEACARVAGLCRAALEDRREEGAALLAGLAEVRWGALPSLGATWCLERLTLARLLLDFDADPGPEHWLSGESVAVRLLVAVPMAAHETISALVRGESLAGLRERVDVLRAKHGTDLPKGSITLALVEALGRVAEDPGRGGPAGSSDSERTRWSPVADSGLAEPAVRLVTELVRLLHGPVEELGPDRFFTGNPYGVLVRRLLVRTVIIRRAAALPQEAAAGLAVTGEEAGVEPEWLALARAAAAGDGAAYERARAEVRRSHPRVAPAPWRSGPDDRGTRFRNERMAVLSRREQEVARRLSEGAATAEIAAELGVSVRTVGTHIRNLYRKLDVHSRTALRAEIVL